MQAELKTFSSTKLPNPFTTPLHLLDVSDPRLYEQDAWRPYFARLRNEDPVHYLADSPFGPYWSVTRFEDIVFVDSHHEIFSSEPFIIIGDIKDELQAEAFIWMDNPRHDEQRHAVQPVVAPQNLANLEGIIRERACRILDDLPVGVTFDWVQKVSIELTTQMLATLFNFPFEQRNKLTYWSDLATATPDISGATSVSHDERLAGLMDCLKTFTGIWHERLTQAPGFDLISLMQRDEATRSMVERPMEFLGNIALLIIGGNDTTRNSITGSVLALNQSPTEYAKLRANPALIPSMISETIRWQTPLIHMRRLAKQDVILGGKQIKKGDKVVMWYLSGNRDESVIERADEFVIDRKNPRHHLSFGFGIHRCMGNRLAEMQLRVLWEEIMRRFSYVEVMEQPVRVGSNFVRGYESLPVRLHAL